MPRTLVLESDILVIVIIKKKKKKKNKGPISPPKLREKKFPKIHLYKIFKKCPSTNMQTHFAQSHANFHRDWTKNK